MWQDVCDSLGINWDEYEAFLFGWDLDFVNIVFNLGLDYFGKFFKFITDNYLLVFLLCLAVSVFLIRLVRRAFSISKLR